MSLSVFNTLSGQKETFTPLTPGKVGIYVCGPTVYDMSHIGHARVYVAFDTIVRYLRCFYVVTCVRNYTDVDDKIIKRANEIGEPSLVVSERFIAEFKRDMASLAVLPADVEPKVTEHIPEIISIIEKLIANGVGYAVDGDVYYAVNAFPGYGKLGRRSLDDMEAGARVEVDPRKRHPMDFALWKSAKPGEPSWESPWGKGRPGWHIECSAMSEKHLGDTFDLHGGGKDLIFPHHENEIAQSEAAHHKPFVRYWLHNGFVTTDNEKMSKSLGNFFTIREVLEKFDAATLRYYLLTTHYRSPINFSDQALREAEARVKYIYETLARLETAIAAAGPGESDGVFRAPWVGELWTRFCKEMDDDFNTAKALGDLSEAFKLVNDVLDKPQDKATDARTLRKLGSELGRIGKVLGLFDAPAAVVARLQNRKAAQSGVDKGAIDALVAERNAARKAKDFKRADQIRDELLGRGIVIKDGAGGTTWEHQ